MSAVTIFVASCVLVCAGFAVAFLVGAKGVWDESVRFYQKRKQEKSEGKPLSIFDAVAAAAMLLIYPVILVMVILASETIIPFWKELVSAAIQSERFDVLIRMSVFNVFIIVFYGSFAWLKYKTTKWKNVF